MIGFLSSIFGGGSSNSSNSSSSYASVDASQPRSSANLQNKNSAFSTIKMDLGIEPKNERYYADLAGRQERSKALMESMMSSSSDSDNDSPASASTGTSSGGTSAATIDPAVEGRIGAVGGAADSVTGGAGGSTSGGTEADAQVDEIAKKGRASTILTDARGLLGTKDEEDKTRRRRSLIGG